MYEYHTVNEVAAILRCHPMTVRRLIQSGELPSTRPTPGRVLVPAQGLQRFLDSKTTGVGDESPAGDAA